MDRSCVPTQPLLDFITRKGLAVRAVGKIVGTRMHANPQSVERMLHRASTMGSLTPAAADEICIGLDVHPVEVWGQDWFNFGEEMADAV